MRIFNVMMSKDLGGIQQAFIDYHDALAIKIVSKKLSNILKQIKNEL